MDTYSGYTFQLNQVEIDTYWPFLKEGENFHFTSWSKRNKKCIWYALMADKGLLEMNYFAELFDLDKNSLDHSAVGYAKIFNRYYNFEFCDNANYLQGCITIVLYESDGDFKHVARVLPNGNFTSKIGHYEDIEHYTMEAVSGEEYGYPKICMRKRIDEMADYFSNNYNPNSHR